MSARASRSNQLAAAGSGLPATLLLLGPPVVWIVRIAASYILVPFACQASGNWPIHLATAIAALLIGGMTALSVARWRRARDRATSEPALDQRSRFLTGFAVLSGALFFLVVAAEGVMPVLIHPCL